MTGRHRRRISFRAGTESYAHAREAELRRLMALDRANAARAKTPETRRRVKRRISDAQRALRDLQEREKYRARLPEQRRQDFARLPIHEQQRLAAVEQKYPDGLPPDAPDPFVGRNRELMWEQFYATRAGFRQRRLKRKKR